MVAKGDEHDVLVHQGTHLMLDRLLKDLQAEDVNLQGRALQALHSITKGSRNSMPIHAVQAAFQAGGGLPRLVALLDTAATPKHGAQRSTITSGAINALTAMTRNCTDARREAIEAGAVPALCNILGTGDDEPVSIEVLKALYTIIAPDSTGHTTTEVFASGGVHALIRLLENVLEWAGEPQRSVWVRELMALLYPLVRRSRMVARLLASEVAGICCVLQSVGDPLSLSLGLDILEEILVAGDRAKYAKLMAREGALAAVVQAAHVRGMGGRAVLVLAQLAADPELLHVLRAQLQPPDYACLVRIAARAVDADDLDGEAVVKLLGALLAGPGVGGVRALALGRCLGSTLSLPPLGADLLIRSTSDAGLVALQNLPADNITEAAIAAALLLEHAPRGVAVLLRPGALRSLVAAVLDENAALPPADSARAEATEALAGALAWLPQVVEAPARQGTATSADLGHNGRDGHYGRDSPAAGPPNGAPNGSGSSGQVPHANGTPASSQAAASADPDGFETMTFHVGGREFHCLAWVLARASRAIARTLQSIPDRSTAAVVIPDTPGLQPSRMYEVFALATECAAMASYNVLPEDCLDLWALAATLQMGDIQRRCEGLAAGLLGNEDVLDRALSLTAGHRESGDGLREVCAQHVLDHLMQLRESGTLARLATAHRAELQACITAALRRRLLAAKPLPLRGSQLLAAAASAATQSANGNDSPYSLASSRCPGIFRARLPSGVELAEMAAMERQASQASSAVSP